MGFKKPGRRKSIRAGERVSEGSIDASSEEPAPAAFVTEMK
jgi:hypothetical protein